MRRFQGLIVVVLWISVSGGAQDLSSFSGQFHCEQTSEDAGARHPVPQTYVGWANVSLDANTGDISVVKGVRGLSYPPDRFSGRATLSTRPGRYVSELTYRLSGWSQFPRAPFTLRILDFRGLKAPGGGRCTEMHLDVPISNFAHNDWSDVGYWSSYDCVPYAAWRKTRSMQTPNCH